MNISIANLSDAEEIYHLQKRAYRSEAELNDDFSIPALTQTLENFIEEFSQKHILKIVENGKIIASGQAYQKDNTCYIGRLMVEPDLQGKGLGSLLLKTLEESFADVQRYELFTGDKSLRNIKLYERKGYKIFKRESLGNTTVVFMEKYNANQNDDLNPIVKRQIEKTIHVLKTTFQDHLYAIYLYGSSVDGGIKHESDIDIMVIITRNLSISERKHLAEAFLEISAPIGCIDARALEITILNKDDICNQPYPFQYQMQYGEWLRNDILQGLILSCQTDPDITILLKKVQLHHQILWGKAPYEWIPSISDHDIKQAMQDIYPQVIAHWNEDNDESNQILALCRMCYTLQFNKIVPKDIAATWFLQFLNDEDANILKLMIDEYTGQGDKQNWQLLHKQLSNVVALLANKIEQHFI